MKLIASLLACALVFGPGSAAACGTHLPAVQAKIDAEKLAALQSLARIAAQDAEAIFIGTVTELTRPSLGALELGSASFAVEETLKGKPSVARTEQWADTFVYSCQESAMFHNVGFRPGGKFIVYVRDGKVIRSAAADHLRSGLLTLEKEQAIAVAAPAS